MEETETVLTLADFGALLRERRIHKGLTEENVAAELKITSRLVKAIEEGTWNPCRMPYMPGDLSAYAKLLAVDDSVTHAACALLKIRKKSCANRKAVLSPLRHVARKSCTLACHPLCALFAGGAWYFRDSIPGLSAIR
ncbi:MAG: helix-turn-helix domain-containing protein [Bilophila wadsworthia]